MFKQCSNCKKVWVTRDEFLLDPQIVVIGYQADFRNLEKGLYLFNHERPGCGTTLACYVEEFIDLYTGPFFRDSRFNTDECPGYCRDKNNLQLCPAECKNSFPRRLLNYIESMKG